MNVPTAIVLDKRRDLFVANFGDNSVSVYAPAGKRPKAVIRTGIDDPVALAIDENATLYVANDGASASGNRYGWVSVYPRGKVLPSRTIAGSLDGPIALTLDRADDLYVTDCFTLCNHGAMTIYSNDSVKQRVGEHLYMTISASLARNGDLFVANYQGGGANGSVSVFEHGSLSWSRDIVDGVDAPRSIAFDAGNRVYVANFGFNDYSYPTDPGSVTVYDPGDAHPSRTIRRGIHEAYALVFDSKQTLYVANYGDVSFGGSVTAYAPGASSPSLVLREGISHPTSIAVWPPSGNL